MNTPGLYNLGDAAISAAVTNSVITSAPDEQGQTQAYIDGLDGMESVSLEFDFVYGSGGTSCIAIVETSLNQGSRWIEIARVDFATANRFVAMNLSTLLSKGITSIAALAAEGVMDGILGDRLRARITSTGVYANNTSLSVRAAVR